MKNTVRAWWKRSVGNRLLGGFLLFLLPVAYLGGEVLAEKLDDITFAREELAGADVLESALVVQAQSMNTISDAARGTYSAEAALNALDILDGNIARSGRNWGLKDESLALRGALQKVASSNEYRPQVVREVSTASFALVRRIGEESKLLLDPELETFYHMEVVVLRAPLLMERVAYFGNANFGLPDGTVGADTSIARQAGRLEMAELEFEQSADAARNYETDAADRHALKVRLTAVRTAVTAITAMERLAPSGFDTSEKVRAEIKAAASLSAKLLREDIQARIDGLTRELVLALGGALALFVIVLVGMFRMVRNGVIQPLKQLTAAVREVAAGDLDAALDEDRVRTAREDELGDLARALFVFRREAMGRLDAEHAAKARGEFLAVMSHEIRTPLNGVLGMTEALKATSLDPAQARMVGVVLESGKTLLAILNDILDLSKLEAGKVELEQIAFEPSSLAHAARDLFDERATEKGLNLIVEEIGVSEKGDWRLGDPNRVRQMLFNLMSNAIKFTASGQVTVTVDMTGADHITLKVADTGIGIPADKLDRLFGKYAQMDASHARLYGGTGLGLSIISALAEAMGATIDVQSVEGAGSVFTLRLPAPKTDKPADETGEGWVPAASGEAKPADDLAILVAEDNPTNRFVLETLFGQIGLSAVFAENGRIAYDVWKGARFDIILMDMQMPEWDGETAIRAIRAEEASTGRRRTPIVTLTANAMPQHIKAQFEAGADGHATKPIQLPALLAAMQAAMDACASAQDAA
jgi:signal transduction histidine kinase/CheY-like chemotaxis protein